MRRLDECGTRCHYLCMRLFWTFITASAITFILAITLTGRPRAAEQLYCQRWATKVENYALGKLDSVPTVNIETGHFLWLQAYTWCLNLDQEPPFPVTAADIRIDEPVGKSGFRRGSDEWTAWCRANYPKSFDPVAGTVQVPPWSANKKIPCPG